MEESILSTVRSKSADSSSWKCPCGTLLLVWITQSDSSSICIHRIIVVFWQFNNQLFYSWRGLLRQKIVNQLKFLYGSFMTPEFAGLLDVRHWLELYLVSLSSWGQLSCTNYRCGLKVSSSNRFLDDTMPSCVKNHPDTIIPGAITFIHQFTIFCYGYAIHLQSRG